MDRIATYAASTLESFQTNIQEHSDHQLLIYSENIATMHQSSYERMEKQIATMEQKLKVHAEQLEALFYQRFDQAMEVGIQEIHECVDDVTEKFNAHADTVIQNIGANAPKVDNSVPRHPRFQNVDPGYAAKIMNFVHSNPYAETPVTTPKPDNQDPNKQTDADIPSSHQDWGEDGPGFQPSPTMQFPHQGWYPGSTTNHHSTSIDGLPMVQLNDFLKRVTIVYPGREQSYTWYLQVKSGAQQYGIYLIAMDQFKKDKSLCPTEFYGITIRPSRYHEMKNSLYQFLAQPVIIPTESAILSTEMH